MKSSLANNPVLPLAAGIGVLAIFLGSMQNADKPEEANTDLAGSSTEVTADASVPEPASATEPATDAVADAVAKATLTAGKAKKVGGLSLTPTAVTAKGATFKSGSSSYKFTTGKAAKVGKYTVTVTKVNPAKKTAAVSVTGG